MASAQIKIPNDLMDKLSRLGSRTDEVVTSVLEAGGEVVLDAVRSNLESVIGKDTKFESRSKGELVRSLGLSPVKLNRKNNHDIKVGFNEPRSDGGINSLIATVLEYGRHNQPPRPFMAPARASSRKAAVAAMTSKFEEEVEKT